MSRQKERDSVAALCLHAGTKATKCSNFVLATTHVDLGITLLGNEAWDRNYDLALSLYSASAELAMCLADFEKLSERIDSIRAKQRTPLDCTGIYVTRIYSLGVAGDHIAAIRRSDNLVVAWRAVA